MFSLGELVVLGLTLSCTYNSIRNPTVAKTMKMLLEEGLVYYRCLSNAAALLRIRGRLLTWNFSVIFCVTFVLTLMIVFAPPGIQNICAQYVLLRRASVKVTC